MSIPEGKDAIRYFENYLSVTGLPHTGPEIEGDPELIDKRVGLVNGASWIVMWSYYFGRQFLPGAHLIPLSSQISLFQCGQSQLIRSCSKIMSE